jgi:hypothetical protein
LAVELESVTSRAIDKIDQILALPLDRDDACFGNMLRSQTREWLQSFQTVRSTFEAREGR